MCVCVWSLWVCGLYECGVCMCMLCSECVVCVSVHK